MSRSARVGALAAVALVALSTSACSDGADRAASPTSAPIVSATSRNGVTVLSIALGRLEDPANTFYELLTSPGPGQAFVLTTPTGTTTNGGIVVSSPSGIAAIRQFDLLKSSAIVQLIAGRESGAAEMAPALGPGPSSVAANPTTGAIAVLTQDGTVVEAPSVTGSFHTIATLEQMKATATSCAPSAITAIAYNDAGQMALGLRCTRSGVAGLVARTASGFAAMQASTAGVGQVLRLDGGPDGAIDALVTTTSGVVMLRIAGPLGTEAVVRQGERGSVFGTLVSTAHTDAGGGAYSFVTSHPAPNSQTMVKVLGMAHPDARDAPETFERHSAVLVVPQGEGGPLKVWVTNGGTVHLQADGAEQILKVAVPYGSAH